MPAALQVRGRDRMLYLWWTLRRRISAFRCRSGNSTDSRRRRCRSGGWFADRRRTTTDRTRCGTCRRGSGWRPCRRTAPRACRRSADGSPTRRGWPVTHVGSWARPMNHATLPGFCDPTPLHRLLQCTPNDSKLTRRLRHPEARMAVL